MTNARPITSGPKHHWFGYYDKLQFDPSGRYGLAMEVDFEHRSPAAEDVVGVGMIDLADGDRWIELGGKGVVLAAGLYAAVDTRLGQQGRLERP